MKIFKFVKKVFFIGLTSLSNFRNVIPLYAIPLSCISMKNQDHKLLILIVIIPYFTLLLIILIIHMQKFVFLTNKQRWNKDKCRCQCKELIDNPSNC